MKIANLLLGTFVVTAAFSLQAQEETEQERECKRMRFLAQEENKIKNYAGAATYYLKGETLCGGYDAANYDRMIGTLRNAVATETDKTRKAAYTDTLVAAYDRQEKAGFYDPKNDLIRATFIVQTTKPDRAKADELYNRGIHAEGMAVNEAHVSYYYYNLYVHYTEVPAEKKADLKKRLIADYFFLSKMIGAQNMSVKTQENLLAYFNGVVKSCDDILPELKGFMSSLPQEIESKKASVNNFILLLEMKSCTESKEYGMLIDTLIYIDPSVNAIIGKAKYLKAQKKFSESISTLKEAKGMADAEQKEEIEYMILDIMYTDQKNYKGAYGVAMDISGKYRSTALKMAAGAVAQTANSCGSSTFERKANYLYAAQLAERAGDSGAAARYRNSGPTDGDWFEAGVSSVTLSCWGVTVSR
jgi:hypothetical protein